MQMKQASFKKASLKAMVDQFSLRETLQKLKTVEETEEEYLSVWYAELFHAKTKARASEGKEGVKTELLWRKIVSKMVKHGYSFKPQFKNVQECAKAIDDFLQERD